MNRLLLLLAALSLVLPVLVQAEEDPTSMDDLGGVDDIDPAVKKTIDRHLWKARRFIDKARYAKARAELEAADELVEMYDPVLELMDTLGELEDEMTQSAKVLQEIEKEQIELEKKKKLEDAKEARVQGVVASVKETYGLPKRLRRAVLAMKKKRPEFEVRVDDAEKERDRCIAAAALAHAATGARRCKEVGEKESGARRRLKEYDADFAVLTEAFSARKGKKALRRLLK